MKTAIKKVLFICQGNICRSPMAKVIMEQTLKEQKLEDKISVESAGIFIVDTSATAEAIDVVREHYGIDLLSQHTPKPYTNLNLSEFDLILTMTENLKRRLLTAKTFTLREYAGYQGDIQDPYLMGIDAYKQCRDEIKKCILIIVEKICRDIR